MNQLANLIIAAVLLLPAQHAAAWSLDRSIIEMRAGQPMRQDVTVRNPTDQTMFFEVTVLEVFDPGTEQERREVVRNPEEIGFIATPARLVVPPQSRRLVRMVNLDGHGDTERVYRVNVTPVRPREEELAEMELQAPQFGLSIVIAHQVLVFIGPEKADVSLKGSREGKVLHLRNEGNVNLALSQGEQCPRGGDEDSCQSVAVPRLYPGNEVRVELPFDQAVDFRMRAAGRWSRVRFD